MAFPVRACALVGRFVDPRVAESVNALLPLLQKRKIQVLVSEDAVFLTEVRGVVRVPESPGLGMQLDESKVESQRIVRWTQD